MIIHNPILTGSFTVNGTDVSSITSSAANITSLNAATASLNTFSASMLTFTAIAATTGSNTFVGNQVVTGSLTVTGSITTPGTLTAQTLVVQTITSSVDFVTGSTKFGSIIDNTHVFTGSVNITGSTNLIGSLSGTSAEFSGNNHSLASNNTLRFTDTDTATEANQQIGKIEFYSSDSSTPGAGVKAYIGAFAQDTTPDAYLSFATQDGSATPNPVERLRISSEGAATFSSIIGVNGATEEGWSLKSNGNLKIENSNGTTVLQVNDTSTGGKTWSLISAGAGNVHSVAAGTFYLRNSSDSLTAFTIASTGAATFSSTAQNAFLINSTNTDGPILQIQNSGNNLGLIGNAEGVTNGGATNFAIRATNNLIFSTGGANPRMTITSDGNVGIGTTPSAWGTVFTKSAIQFGGSVGVGVLWTNSFNNGVFLGNNLYDDGAGNARYIINGASTQYVQAGGEHFWSNAPSGTAGNVATFTERMRLTGGGTTTLQLGNYTGNTDIQLTASTTGYSSVLFGDGTSGINQYRGYIQYQHNGDYFIFATDSTERMRITSGGQVITTMNAVNNNVVFEQNSTNPYGPWFKFTTDANNGTNYYWVASALISGNEYVRAKLLSNGGLANYSGNNVNLASDIRLKRDIIPLSSEWDKLKQIEVVNFRYKDSNEETTLYGAIAQQVQEVYPELVIVTREATETEPEYYGLREQPFQWLTTKVLQEAMAKIDDLQAQINELKNK